METRTNMKKKQLFISMGAALGLGFGLFAGLNLKEAKQAYAATETTVYCAISSEKLGSYTLKLNTNQQTNPDAWYQYTMTNTGDTFGDLLLYSCSFTDLWDGVDKMQFQLYDGDTHKEQVQPISSWTESSAYNGKVWEYDGNSWKDLSGEEIEHTFALKGSRDSWAEAFGAFDDEAMTITVHLDKDEVFKFMMDGSSWYGYSSLATPGAYFSGEGEGDITVNASGTYVFTIPENFLGSGITYTMTPDVANGAYLRGDWGTEGESDWGWSEGGQLAMTGNGPFTVSNVPLSANGEIKMVIYNDGIITWTQPSESSAGTAEFPAARTGEGGNVAVEKDGLYDITVTLVSGTTYTYSLVGKADEYLTAATNFATGFVSDMYAGCPYNYSTSAYNDGKTSDTLASLWETKVSAYAALDPKAQEYLNTTKGSSVTAISTMWASYDYVYGHYATVRAVDGADFLGRTPAQVANYVMSADGFNSGSNAALTAALIGGVSVVAIGGSFFLLRRKREN